MALTLTFLGKGGTGRTTLAIAAAKTLAARGQRVLLVGQDPGPAFGLMVGLEGTAGDDPQELAPNLQVVQPQVTTLLQRNWEELKALEARYLRDPFFKNVYGEELAVLPGLDRALILNALRQYDDSNRYDAIVYDGSGDLSTLRMLGLPEVLAWYVRRFRKVIGDSDFAKTLSPFVQPVSAAVLTAGGGGDRWQEPLKEVETLLDRGRSVLADPARVAAWLVSTPDPAAIATAKYLWGSAQQSGIIVGGALLNRASDASAAGEAFAPLLTSPIPERSGDDWQPLQDAMPDFAQAKAAPNPVEVDAAQQQVRLFLPGFDKKQVKLTQYGPELTVEAGDQRRNVLLPPQLSGKPVTGAKFQNGYLIVSF